MGIRSRVPSSPCDRLWSLPPQKTLMSRTQTDCRIYVGNLPPDVRTKDIEDLFYKFGKITYIDLKNRRGPPFSFIEFDDAR